MGRVSEILPLKQGLKLLITPAFFSLNGENLYSKAETKKELIHEAFKELIAAEQRLDLRELRGEIGYRSDYDYKKLRKGN